MIRLAPAVVAVLALSVAGCGGSSNKASTPATAPAAAPAPAVASPVLDRCLAASKAVPTPADLFPTGLLPAPSRVFAADSGAGTAAADVALPLRNVLLALRANAPKLGYSLGDQDFEGIEAELELNGSNQSIELQLKRSQTCTGVTVVTAHH